MMRSMLADQPYSPVTSTHGESARRLETMTLSTLSSSTSFMSLHRPSVAALASSNSFFSSSVSSILRPSFVAEMSFLPSYSLSCCTAYSSIGSTMYSTSSGGLAGGVELAVDDVGVGLNLGINSLGIGLHLLGVSGDILVHLGDLGVGLSLECEQGTLLGTDG